MSQSSQSSPTKAAAKPRSPVEKAIVWGGIAVLLVLVGIEMIARWQYTSVANGLTAKVADAETSSSGEGLREKDVKEYITGKTPQTVNISDKRLANGAQRMDVYTWFTLSPIAKRELYVYYGHGDNPEVLSVSSSEDNETIEMKFAPPTAEEVAEMKKTADARAEAELRATRPAKEQAGSESETPEEK
jgi:hypothetical protein